MGKTKIIDNFIDQAAHRAVLQHKKEEDKNPYLGVDPILLAYFFIHDALHIGQQSAQITSKNLQNNALQQNNIIALEQQQTFQTLRWDQLFTPGGGYKKAAQTDLDQMQAKNQQTSALRSLFENQLNVLRQNAQINETNLNSAANNNQQAFQQGGSFMQMLISLVNQITRI